MSIENDLILPRVKLSLRGIDNMSVVDIDEGSIGQPAKELVYTTRRAFETGITKSLEFRKKQLNGLLKFLKDYEADICDALFKDLRKSKHEALITEIEFIANDIRSFLHNLKDYMKPKKAEKGLSNFFDGLYVYNDPYGVVLVIGPWNYPLQLCLGPLAGAIAAGNAAIIKPSEISSATAYLLQTVLPKYLNKECYPIYVGGVEETTELLNERFDYIFFTGSTQTGKIIYNAAHKFLTPVTLELGGKSPVYIDDDVDIDIAVKRLLWGKLTNCGQTCIAPDYILCSRHMQEKLIKLAPNIIKEMFSSSPKTYPDYGRIISKGHFQRLCYLMQNQKIAVGGQIDEGDLYIEPTILIDVSANDDVMKEEIFGPILPILNINDAKEAITFINRREKPLALYIFSKNSEVINTFIESTSSGGVCVNDTLMHIIPHSLPFGGVGNSGFGSYHGKHSFDTFVHKKSVLVKNFHLLPEKIQSLKYPPYSKNKTKFIVEITKKRRGISMKFLLFVFIFLSGVLFTVGCYYLKTYCDKQFK